LGQAALTIATMPALIAARRPKSATSGGRSDVVGVGNGCRRDTVFGSQNVGSLQVDGAR